MTDLSVQVAGVPFKNPIIPASGVFGYGHEYEELFPLSKLGGIATKGTTITPRPGNPSPRIAETPSGMLNSVGLQNPGIDAFIERELPYLLTKDTVILANIAGSTIEECVTIAERLDQTDVHMIELNISCPNVKKGGAAFGVHCDSAERITAAVRQATKKPLVVKLSPNVTDITEIAKAVEAAGADASSIPCWACGLTFAPSVRFCGTMSAECLAQLSSRLPFGWYGRFPMPFPFRSSVWAVWTAVQLPWK